MMTQEVKWKYPLPVQSFDWSDTKLCCSSQARVNTRAKGRCKAQWVHLPNLVRCTIECTLDCTDDTLHAHCSEMEAVALNRFPGLTQRRQPSDVRRPQWPSCQQCCQHGHNQCGDRDTTHQQQQGGILGGCPLDVQNYNDQEWSERKSVLYFENNACKDTF